MKNILRANKFTLALNAGNGEDMKRKIITVIVVLSVITTALLFPYEMIYNGKTPSVLPGEKGDTVAEAQQLLTNWDLYTGPIDGNFNFNTILSLLNYQKSKKLPQSGIFDDTTLNAMGLSSPSLPGYAYAATKANNEQLLARAIHGESRGEPYEGQVAVGSVILNRTKNAKFPKSIPGVIYQPGAFTAVSDGQINVPMASNSSALKAARDALSGWDPSNGCIYYWNPATATSKWIWSRKILKKIGKHNFAR